MPNLGLKEKQMTVVPMQYPKDHWTLKSLASFWGPTANTPAIHTGSFKLTLPGWRVLPILRVSHLLSTGDLNLNLLLEMLPMSKRDNLYQVFMANDSSKPSLKAKVHCRPRPFREWYVGSLSTVKNPCHRVRWHPWVPILERSEA